MSAVSDQIDAAILVCAEALAAGQNIVEYEINGRRVRRTDPAQAIQALAKAKQALAASGSASSTAGIFSLGRT
jgi:uncharacterized protein YqfA (UPF0365 family)